MDIHMLTPVCVCACMGVKDASLKLKTFVYLYALMSPLSFTLGTTHQPLNPNLNLDGLDTGRAASATIWAVHFPLVSACHPLPSHRFLVLVLAHGILLL